MTAGEAGGDELIGKVLGGRYRVTATIGRGGMGVVARAVDQVLNREVAVKVLRAFTDASAPELLDLRARMQREAQAAARIRHSGVVTVHDVTEEQGLPVIVMELVDGPSLDDVLTERGTLEPQEAAAIGAKLMDALDAAHRVGVLHRDVKPGNVLLEHGGRVVLTDFGIATMDASGDEAMAKLTHSGHLVGSLDYLPPERAQGTAPGPASDIWSLGMTLYAAVEGTSPFRRTSVWSTLSAIVTEPLPQPRRAGPLAPVLWALMAKEPANRPTAEQAREMLQRAAAGQATNLVPPAPTAPTAVPAPAVAPAPPQAAVPAPPPGFGTAPPFHQASPPPPQPPPHTGYAPSGPSPVPQAGPSPVPQAVPQSGVPTAGYAPGAIADVDRGRRRRRVLIAAAAALVMLAGGGVTYALTGENGADDGAPQAAPGAGVPAASGQPNGGAIPGGKNSPGASSSTGAGTPSTSASSSPSSTTASSASPSARPSATPSASASPSTKPSSAPATCSGWSHHDPEPGTYGYLSGDHHILTGPYQVCSSVAATKSGTKLWFHCSVENSYGHKWLYVRIAGTDNAGWMSADNIIRQSGWPVRC
ncbi:serine/threonine protein kinase (plasmid) [Streptomyces sp. BHT-5-2]|uniref:serine/threonine-protein kinase n=1 Tax=Streptomyces sp. BHT-5-2 TaxID=2866715 RepID=UPI001C8DA55E|nr:serine/threonine-protein kinase [Streptomyces sp. BHT-5-2]QZL09039.1 serine/threonine protein kinase [Streptomyces sp. BHT-5-2]